MGETGIVDKIVNDDVIVIMKRSEACKKCRACVSGLQEKEMTIKAKNICNAKVGDEVELSLNPSNFLNAVYIMYGIPLIALILGFFIGYLITKNLDIGDSKEIINFLIGIIFMFISYAIIKLNESKFKTDRYKPVAIKIVKNKI